MTHGPLAGKIIRFALPLAASSMLQQMFNAADLAQAGSDLAGLFGGLPLTTAESIYYLRSYAGVFLFSVVGATPVVKELAGRIPERVAAVLEPVALAALLLVCTGYLVDGSFNPFLYFRF